MRALALRAGNGGSIELNVSKRLRISGVHSEPTVNLTSDLFLEDSAVEVLTGLGGGNGGNVLISAGILELTEGGKLTTMTLGSGNGGMIEVKADSVLVSGINAELMAFLSERGGEIDLAKTSILANTDGRFLGDNATGNAGKVQITTVDLQIQDGAIITTTTGTPGLGGIIEIISDRAALSNNSTLSATNSSISANAGNAGKISIIARDNFQIDNSTIITDAVLADGGDILITETNDLR